MKKVLQTATGYHIHESLFRHPLMIDTLRVKLSSEDFKTKTLIPVGIFKNGEFYSIPLIPKSVLTPLLLENVQYIDIPPWSSRSIAFKAVPPLPFQVPVINEVLSEFKHNTRCCLTLQTGYGKTYTAFKVASELGCKMLFITKLAKLVDQAEEDARDKTSLKKIYAVRSGRDFINIFEDAKGLDCDLLIMTHSMATSILNSHGNAKFIQCLKNAQINMTIYDEFDLSTGSTYLLSTILNTRYNLYLTGTPFKSLPMDDRVFQMVFKSAPVYGKNVYLKPNKDCLVMYTKSVPTPKEYMKVMRTNMFDKNQYKEFFGKKDFIWDQLKKKYYDDKNSLFKQMVEKEDGQVAFIVGRIENCNLAVERLVNEWGIERHHIGIVNNTISTAEKDKAMKKPWLVSIGSSIGRGIDSSMMRVLVMLEFTFSESEFQQIIGRVGRIGKKKGYLIYPVDLSFPKVGDAFKRRQKLLAQRCENIKYDYLMPVDEKNLKDNYYYGYRKGGNEAEAIIAHQKSKKANKTEKSHNLDSFISKLKIT